jgi:molecular chaperone GrpE
MSNNNGETTNQEQQPRPVDEENGNEPPEQVITIEQPAAETEKEDPRLLQLMADFDNYRKRTNREMASERQKGRREAVTKLLPVLDAVDNALLATPADSPFRPGLEGVRQQFLTAFGQLGFTRIAAVGESFNPEFHEAIAQFPSSQVAEGIIIQESRAGFRDEVGLLRAAQVVVSAGSGS